MQYNTTSFTNISDKDFTGKFDSKNYLIKAGETRYFPTVLSQHLAKLLSEKLVSEEDKKGFERETMLAETKSNILGEEIKTKSDEVIRSFKDEALEHERKYLENLKEEKEKNKVKKLKAIKITKK